MWCLQLEITTDEINRLEIMVNEWVRDYEKYIASTGLAARIVDYLYLYI
jgi:hypothetical protein